MEPHRAAAGPSRLSRATSLRHERRGNSAAAPAAAGLSSLSLNKSTTLEPTLPRPRDASPSKLPQGPSLKKTGDATFQLAAKPGQHRSGLHARHNSVSGTSSIRRPDSSSGTSGIRRPDSSSGASGVRRPESSSGPTGHQSSHGATVRRPASQAKSEDSQSRSHTEVKAPSGTHGLPRSRVSKHASVDLDLAAKDRSRMPPPPPPAASAAPAKASSHSLLRQGLHHVRTGSLGSSRNDLRDARMVPSAPNSPAARDTSKAQQTVLTEPPLELLQLHAIHSRSGRTQQEWTESARKFYEARFLDLVSVKKALEARELDLLLQRNAAAIIDWGARSGGANLERKIQVLSTTLDDVWQLTKPTGRYTLLVLAFEHWYDTAGGVNAQQAGHSRSTEGLGDGWKAELATLQEELLLAANATLSLGDVEGDSDIARVVGLVLEMVKNMLEEVELMESIEQAVVVQQQAWVQSTLDELRQEI